MSIEPNAIVKTTCPACGTKMRFHEALQLGQFVVCLECGTELEVIGLNPVRLDWAFEEPIEDEDWESDWEDDWEDDDDYEDEDDWDDEDVPEADENW